MRVLVTASRDHYTPDLIHGALDQTYHDWCVDHPEDTEFVVVHGDARGGDQFAKNWALAKAQEDSRVRHEAHPADWDRYYRAAGFKRNQKMVDIGADRCLGFPIGKAAGTRDCMRRAKKARIPLQEYGPTKPWRRSDVRT